jgi:uncharacterized phosphosugar-binding protein
VAQRARPRWLERTEDYVDKYLANQPLNAGDVLVVYSHGGRNSAGIEAAMYAGERGLFTVAVTSSQSLSRPAEHSTGKRLADVCDVMVDTGAPVEDALITVEGWDRPVGGSSTVVASVVSHEIITRTAAVLGSRGVVLPTFVSPTVAGATLASNNEVFAAHRALLHAAEGRAIQER